MDKSLRIAAIEPYGVDSHINVLQAWQRHSQHQISIFKLSGRHWKWRMETGTISLAEQLPPATELDVIFASDYVNVLQLRGLRPDLRAVPIVIYMHENQASYPISTNERADYRYALHNLISMTHADCIFFNSSWHRRDCLQALRRLTRIWPDRQPKRWLEQVEERSTVLPLGIELAPPATTKPAANRIKRILWNHRWEYDKGPDEFFSVLTKLSKQGTPFELLVCGARFRKYPPIFDEACKLLQSHIVHWGYCQSRSEYLDLLATADLVVSTAKHEFFGLSVLEAISAGCHPLLPNRLSYPEILPGAWHADCLYEEPEDLESLLTEHCLGNRQTRPKNELRSMCEAWSWSRRSADFDREMRKAVSQGRTRSRASDQHEFSDLR